jgi:uncharacterized protein YoxC
METTFEISVIVLATLQFLLFAGLLVMIMKLIKAIDNVSAKVDSVQNEVKNVSAKVDPVIQNVNNVISTVGSITEKVNDNMSVVKDAVDKLKETADDIMQFEKKIRRNIEPPVMETITTFNAVIKGITTFIGKLKGLKSIPARSTNGNSQYYGEDEFDEIDEVTDEARSEINRRYEDINKELDEVRSRLSDLKR